MPRINKYSSSEKSLAHLRSEDFGENWPVVYILENGKKMYIGESTRVYYRYKEHLKDISKSELDSIHVISDDEFNMSATKDLESLLIQYLSAEGTYSLLNGNRGLGGHNYFDRERYTTKFEIIWEELKQKKLVDKDLVQIQNTDLFKYSPYKVLSPEQLIIAEYILKLDQEYTSYTQIINGGPGTGKTILAVYLTKLLVEQGHKVGVVVPMVSLRKTLKRVFAGVAGLESRMVIGPTDLYKSHYDILIVDEAHRLRRRKNLANYASFDRFNQKRSLGKEATQLDWVFDSAGKVILFYDRDQTIRPTDVRHEDIESLDAEHHYLTTQQRVAGGQEYTLFLRDFFCSSLDEEYNISNFDFQLFDSIHDMRDKILRLEKVHKLCRLVAGFAWPWASKRSKDAYDIEIDNLKLRWNSVNKGWVNSSNSIFEVGCIHTVQGYDLNYVGVIIGPELSYNMDTQKLVVNKDYYYDVNGRKGITEEGELERYIINVYKVLLTRGIKGAYVYVVDESLRAYLRRSMERVNFLNT